MYGLQIWPRKFSFNSVKKGFGQGSTIAEEFEGVPNQSCSKCPETHFGFGMFKSDQIVFLLFHIHTNTHYSN